jgi:flagellar FliL protein
MADKPETSPEPQATKAPAAGGGSKIVTILLAVNSLMLAGMMALQLLRPGGAAAKPAEAKADEHAQAAPAAEGGDKASKPGEPAAKAGAPGPMVRLPDFVVHLRDSDADRYARVSFEVELKEERGKEVISGRMPHIRDAFLSHLSDRTVQELRGSEAMAQLKDALSTRLREIAPEAPFVALYVTELVVQ